MDDDLQDLFGGGQPANARLEEDAARLAIGRALSQLPEASRARVLRWAIEQFGPPVNAGANADGASEETRVNPAPDPTLSVDDLGDLFDPSRDIDDPSPVRRKE